MAEAKDVQQLARKLREKGLSDPQVVEGLRGMGFTAAEAKSAAAATAPAAPATATPKAPAKRTPTKTPRGGGKPAGPPPAEPAPSAPATPGSAGLPSLSMPSAPSLSLTPPRKVSSGDIGGFVGGLFAYVLFLNYVRYGPEGPKAWFRAKFLNEASPDMDKGLPTTEAKPRSLKPGDQPPGVGVGLNLNRAVVPGDFAPQNGG